MAVRIFADMADSRLTRDINNTGLQPCDWIMMIYGQAVNPHVQIGGNRVELTGTIPAGAYAVINTLTRTITLTTKDGQTSNILWQGVRGSGIGSGTYCFEQIPPGPAQITWPSSFDFDIRLIYKRSDPTWQMD